MLLISRSAAACHTKTQIHIRLHISVLRSSILSLPAISKLVYSIGSLLLVRLGLPWNWPNERNKSADSPCIIFDTALEKDTIESTMSQNFEMSRRSNRGEIKFIEGEAENSSDAREQHILATLGKKQVLKVSCSYVLWNIIWK